MTALLPFFKGGVAIQLVVGDLARGTRLTSRQNQAIKIDLHSTDAPTTFT